MFRLARSLIQIVRAGHLACPFLVSTGIHATLLVALGMIVVGASQGPPPDAVVMAIGLGSSASVAEGELDDTTIADASLFDSGDAADMASPSRTNFDVTEMPPASDTGGDAVDQPLLAADFSASHDLPVSVDSSTDEPPQGVASTAPGSGPGSAAGKKNRSGVSAGKSSGKGVKAGGKPGAKGSKGSDGGSGGSSFFGFSAEGERLVFVVDISGSMHGRRIRRAQTELRHTLEALKPSQKFYIVFFSDGAMPMPAGGLLPATPDNVAQAWQWVRQAQCGGGTNPLPALLLALDLKPDAIYLLTDGKFSAQVLAAATQDPPGHRTPVYTIAFASKKAERLLQAIASETGGNYRFVP